jgi:hypothetical protein
MICRPSGPSPTFGYNSAGEGLKRIAKFYKIEEAIRGQSAEQRKAARQEQTKPL